MQLVIISGPPDAGKSAAAEALCQRYDRMLHIDVEALREMLRMGLLREHDDSPEAMHQRNLFIGSASDMARRFLGAGYGVVIDDVITEKDLAAYQAALTGVEVPAHFVVLLPPLDALLTRDGRPGDRMRALHEQFATWNGVARVDPQGLSPEQVADRIMALAAEGRALLGG